jgi:hypothetical protein
MQRFGDWDLASVLGAGTLTVLSRGRFQGGGVRRDKGGREERGRVDGAGLNMERIPSPPPPKTTITTSYVGVAARRTGSSSDS